MEVVKMASIVSRGNKYAVVFREGEGEAKRQVWKSGLSLSEAETLKKSKDEIEKQQRERERKKKLKAAYVSDVTVEDFLADFVKSYGIKHWGNSYYESNLALLDNYINPYFGHNRLVEVDTKLIDDYYNFLLTECEPVHIPGKPKREHMTASQVNEIHKVLRTAFNQAKRWKKIKENPFVDADVPEHKAKERPALSPEEFEKVLAYTDTPDDYERYVIHVALCIQYYCTTRGGEVGALQWPDYNRYAKTLHIYKAIGRVKKKNLNLPKLKIYYKFPMLLTTATTFIVLKQPKTEASERMSKINNLLIEKLDRLRVMQQDLIENIFGDYYPDSQLIICQPNGRPLMPEQLNRKFKDIILEMCNAGYKFRSVPENQLENVVFHSVRAASATKKLAISGGNIKAVMRAGGWAEPDMVIRYSKTYDEDQVNIVQQMEDGYREKGDGAGTPDKQALLQFITENQKLISEILAAQQQAI